MCRMNPGVRCCTARGVEDEKERNLIRLDKTYLMLSCSRVRRIRDLRVGFLAAIALKILVRELEARLHVCVAGVVE